MNEKYLEWTSRTLEDPDLTAELEAVKEQKAENIELYGFGDGNGGGPDEPQEQTQP